MEQGKEVQRWADSAMYSSKPIAAQEGPQVKLLSAPSDPLGLIAITALTYVGLFKDNLADVTDDERKEYLEDMQLTKLAAPLESVNLVFSIEGVSRAFTHQMVRQRTAAYWQESMRFSVVEDEFADRVILPPSLAGTRGGETKRVQEEWRRTWTHEGKLEYETDPGDPIYLDLLARTGRIAQQERWRDKWDRALEVLQGTYQELVDDGMPAEDARGLLPTNIATRIKYSTNLRALLDHIGNRLCTQAQFEWRIVAARMAEAIREYGRKHTYTVNKSLRDNGTPLPVFIPSTWQFDAIAALFKPVCYQQNKCPMKASFDRKCSIRDRVDLFAAHGVPSACWERPLFRAKGDHGEDLQVGQPIFPAEWLLNPGAAR